MNFDELADYLRVERETIGQYLDEIPSFELGGKLLFRKKSIETWIESKETGFEMQRIIAESPAALNRQNKFATMEVSHE